MCVVVTQGMFERLERFLRKLTTDDERDPDSFDVDRPRPQRANPDPPKRHWYARTRSRSLRALAAEETKRLDALDADDPELSADASARVDDLLTKIGSSVDV